MPVLPGPGDPASYVSSVRRQTPFSAAASCHWKPAVRFSGRRIVSSSPSVSSSSEPLASSPSSGKLLAALAVPERAHEVGHFDRLGGGFTPAVHLEAGSVGGLL